MNIIKKIKHYGKYEELDNLKEENVEVDWRYLEDEVLDTEEITLLSSYDFLHGLCDIFAKALNDTMPEYQRESIYDSQGVLIHSYCTIVKDGIRWFADVRGITSDYVEFIAEFDDFIGFMNLPEYPMSGTKSENDIVSDLSSEEYNSCYYAAAHIIDKYWDIYKNCC